MHEYCALTWDADPDHETGLCLPAVPPETQTTPMGIHRRVGAWALVLARCVGDEADRFAVCGAGVCVRRTVALLNADCVRLALDQRAVFVRYLNVFYPRQNGVWETDLDAIHPAPWSALIFSMRARGATSALKAFLPSLALYRLMRKRASLRFSISFPFLSPRVRKNGCISVMQKGLNPSGSEGLHPFFR